MQKLDTRKQHYVIYYNLYNTICFDVHARACHNVRWQTYTNMYLTHSPVKGQTKANEQILLKDSPSNRRFGTDAYGVSKDEIEGWKEAVEPKMANNIVDHKGNSCESKRLLEQRFESAWGLVERNCSNPRRCLNKMQFESTKPSKYHKIVETALLIWQTMPNKQLRCWVPCEQIFSSWLFRLPQLEGGRPRSLYKIKRCETYKWHTMAYNKVNREYLCGDSSWA